MNALPAKTKRTKVAIVALIALFFFIGLNFYLIFIQETSNANPTHSFKNDNLRAKKEEPLPTDKRHFEPNALLKNKNFYDEKYWSYQEGLGAFGGKAEAFKFRELIEPSDTLIDYGGGGGFLLYHLDARRKILIEPNPHARKNAEVKFGIDAYATPEDVPSDIYADVIISNHCLEHVPNPLEELSKLRQLLKKNGILCIVVPVDAALGAPYSPTDINHHIYTWNALLLGNLVADAGFEIINSEEIQYMWPPNFEQVWAERGEKGFLDVAHQFAVKNNNKQVRLVAKVK